MSLTVFGTHDQNTIDQMQNCLEAVPDSIGVLCADGHKGYSQPVGGVIAYRDSISISGVGFDIGCGNMAVRTHLLGKDVRGDMPKIMDQVVKDISFGIGRNNDTKIDHSLFDSDIWKHPLISPLKQKARNQLGTVGSGNHYIDIFVDTENDHIWVGVHFGSRGLGHGIATAFLKAAGGKDGMDVPPTVVSLNSQLGQDYHAAMELAGEYAYAGREWVTHHVAETILGGAIIDEIHNHHNYAWLEEHNGEDFYVVRKGATPAFPGQRGFIGGSMGDNAVIIEGIDGAQSRQALYSTVHGAGRIMSRTEARGRFVKDITTGKKERQPGKVRHDEWQKWIKDFGITLRGGDLDEAPQAYRRLPEVLAAHDQTIKILHTLKPIGVAMAGNDVVDPYKD